MDFGKNWTRAIRGSKAFVEEEAVKERSGADRERLPAEQEALYDVRRWMLAMEGVIWFGTWAEWTIVTGQH